MIIAGELDPEHTHALQFSCVETRSKGGNSAPCFEIVSNGGNDASYSDARLPGSRAESNVLFLLRDKTMALIFSRPNKLDHADTIRYEIYMLRFSFRRLTEGALTERNAWVYLESFLLHYRSLIDFLGTDKPSKTDLHITNIWKLLSLPEPTNLNQIYAKGKILRARYEPADAKGGGRISQYLHHCTTKRIDFKDWEVSKMYSEIETLLSEVERHLGPHAGILDVVPSVVFLDALTASTTIGTHTAVSAVLVDPNRK